MVLEGTNQQKQSIQPTMPRALTCVCCCMPSQCMPSVCPYTLYAQAMPYRCHLHFNICYRVVAIRGIDLDISPVSAVFQGSANICIPLGLTSCLDIKQCQTVLTLTNQYPTRNSSWHLCDTGKDERQADDLRQPPSKGLRATSRNLLKGHRIFCRIEECHR